jgi:Cu/Ag efflux protein CusF
MRIARAIVAVLFGMLVAFGATVSHQVTAQEKQEKKTEKPAAPAARRHVGALKAVDPAAGRLTVTEKEGDATVSVSEKTAIKKGKESLKLSDLKPGDEVTVVYTKENGKDMARSVTVKAQ